MRRWLYPLLALFLLAAGLELAARLFVLPNPRIVWRPLPPFGVLTNDAQRQWVERHEDPNFQPDGVGRFDPRLGWSYTPGATTEDGKVHINAWGARSMREYTAQVPDHIQRVIACGDSFTFCEEVRDEEGWPARVEAQRSRTEVVNYGVGGFGTGQALLRFREATLGDRVGAVVVGLLLETIGRNVNRYRPRWYPRADSPVAKPRFRLSDDELELVPLPYAKRTDLVRAVRSGRVLDDLAEHEYWSAGLPAWMSVSGVARLFAAEAAYDARSLPRLWSETEAEPFQVTLALLEAFRREADERGAQGFLVLVFPTDADLNKLLDGGGRYWITLLEALAARGIEVRDLSVPLEEAALARGAEDPPLYRGTHLSPTGNEVVARVVGDWLEDLRRRGQ